MKNNWKGVAIVFIILFILETVLFGWLLYLGITEVNREDKCSNEICWHFDSFSYESYNGRCSCYRNNEIVLETYLK